MKSLFSKLTSLSMAFALLFSMASCKSNTDTQSTGSLTAPTTGRYFEIPLETSPMAIKKLKDGTIRSASADYSAEDMSFQFGTSSDGGKTWTYESNEEVNEFFTKNSFFYTAFDAEGNFYVFISPMPEPSSDSAAVMMSSETTLYRIGKDYSIEALNYKTDGYFHSFTVTDQGDVLIQNVDNYTQIDPTTGKIKYTYTTDQMARTYAVEGNTLILQSQLGIEEYDVTTGEKIFSMGWPSAIPILASSSYSIQSAPNQEGYIYYCGQGLYYIPKDGSTPEILMDSSTGSSIFSMDGGAFFTCIYNADKSFVAGGLLTNQATLSYFYYDADAPAIPDEHITIYSLKDNSFVRQAVADFQLAHPEALITYTVGVVEDPMGITTDSTEDALKDLALKIQAGEAPDLMLLDGLPIEKYQQSGLFYDLTDYINSRKDEQKFLTNLVDAFKEDGVQYALPTHFSVPSMAGENSNNIASFEEYATWLGTQSDNQVSSSKDYLFRQYYDVLYPTWFNEDNTLNEKQVRTDLQALKSIYEMQTDDETARRYLANSQYASIDMQLMTIMLDDKVNHLEGNMSSLMDYRILMSYAAEKNIDWNFLPAENAVIIPSTIMSVTKTTKNPELCETFLDSLLVSKDQEAALTVSPNPLKGRLSEDLFTQSEYLIGSFTDEGEMTEGSMPFVEMSEESIATLYEKVGQSAVAKPSNATEKEILLTEVQAYLGAVPNLDAAPLDEDNKRPETAQDLDTTIKNMQSKMGIYLSE